MFLEKEVKDMVYAIQNTEEFKKFKQAKANLKKYRGLKEDLDLFQKKQRELYSMNMQGKESKSLVMEINSSYNKLSQVPEVQRLLNSGKDFNDMMFGLHKSINDLLDSEFER